MAYETCLAKAKKIVEDAQAVTQDVTDTFEILRNINQEYQALKKECDSGDQTMEKACLLVLRSSYVVMKCCATFLFTLLKEMKDKKSKLPQRVQPIIKEIESYIMSMNGDLDELKSAAKQISSKISEIVIREEPVTEEEDFALQLSMEDFKCSLKKVENYKTEAERALGSLQTELTLYLVKECFVTVVKTVVVGAVSGGLAYGGTLILTEAGHKAVNAAAAGGLAITVPYIAWEIYNLSRKYEDHKAELQELNSQLRVCYSHLQSRKKDEEMLINKYKIARSKGKKQ